MTGNAGKGDILIRRLKDVLKSRRPEIVLIVVFQTALILLLQRMTLLGGPDQPQPPAVPGWALFVLGVGSMMMAIVWQMLYLGFLRTTALSGAEPQDPAVLVRTGRPFFWRILGVQIVVGLVLWVIAVFLLSLMGGLLGYQRPEMLPPWLVELTLVASIALMVKPIFGVPSFMLALDIKAIEAAKLIWQIRLSDMGILPPCYGAGLAALAAMGAAASFAPQEGVIYYIAMTTGHLAQSMIFFLLMLLTVLFVAIETEKR